ncbi:RluA family pseudouridine synthase [Ureaplasma canigenitalium]|uniref:RluA family pseudouridine synthase n=1 Tax=Ureaplasma canigenitalium TaxID=42092 RepID=UPI0004E0B803|nr:RluA family pseudouridine synthase [Ureaplasma canigenitalium]
MRKINVQLEQPLRLDIYLVKILHKSRTYVHKLIKGDLITVNDAVINKQNHLVVDKDVIQVNDENLNVLENYKDITPYQFPLEVLYEDEYILLLNKPSGMLVHPTSFNEQNTIANALLHYFGHNHFYLTHRIDKDTSGILLIAKNDESHSILQDQFFKQEIKKHYYAIVENRFGDDLLHFKINEPIGFANNEQLLMKTGTAKNKKDAISIVKVLEMYPHHALVDVQILTGRTHQIRVHMKHINHPIVNDPLYGSKKHTTPYGQYLHAYLLGFKHPVTNEYIEIKTELPVEFTDKIKELKNERSV